MGATMIVLAVLLWTCGIMLGTCGIPTTEQEREMVEQAQKGKLAEWIARQRLDAELEAERQQFLKRWLELKAKEKALEDAEKYKAQ
jgi:hypothetical protein